MSHAANESDLARLRDVMIRPMLELVPEGQPLLVEPGLWVLCLGGSLPDFNMALVETADQQVLEDARTTLADRPALIMLAGSATAHVDSVTEPWRHVGSMPIMTRALAGYTGSPDPRVRLGRSAADIDAATGLAAEAFGMPADELLPAMEPTVRDEITLRTWLLEEDGNAVSCVNTAIVDGVVSIWTMSTPERLGRRGYGRALLDTVLAHAAHEGAHTGVLGATPAGQPLYEATGWSTVEHWQILTNAMSAQFS